MSRIKLRDLILDEYQDSDGYWITLIDGYTFDYSQTRTVIEKTKTEAYKHLKLKYITKD